MDKNEAVKQAERIFGFQPTLKRDYQPEDFVYQYTTRSEDMLGERKVTFTVHYYAPARKPLPLHWPEDWPKF